MAQRRLQFEIFRYDPNDPQTAPSMDHFEIDEEPMMNLFTVLTRIREEQDPSLSWRASCRMGVCGSCAMLIQGRPALACNTQILDVSERLVTIAPLPNFDIIKDLVPDLAQLEAGNPPQQ